MWPAPDSSPDASRTTSLGSPIDAWLKQFANRVVAARKLGTVDLLFDGDQPAPLGGGKKGANTFARVRTFDFGSTNEPTQVVLWRLQQGQVEGLHPRMVVLQVGNSNISINTPAQIAEGVKAVVAEYQKLCPEAVIILHALLPRGDKASDPNRARVKAVNDLIAPLGDGKKVIYLDFTDKLLDAEGNLSKEAFNENMHLSAKGHLIWADALQPLVAEHIPATPPAAPATNDSAAPAPTAESSPAPKPPGGTLVWPVQIPKGGNPAVIPSPNLSWIPRFQENMDDAHKLKQVDLIFDGDSITAGWKGSGNFLWRKYAKLNGIDFGQPGHGTQSILWRLNNGQVDGLKPRLIVLLIGTNNLGAGTQQVVEGIKAVVTEYQKRCPEAVILLQGIFPRGEKADNPARGRIKEINKTISALGDGKKIIYMDFGDKLLQPDGVLSREIMPDFLHPVAKGYKIWAEAIQPVIEQFFPEAKEKETEKEPAAPAPAAAP